MPDDAQSPTSATSTPISDRRRRWWVAVPVICITLSAFLVCILMIPLMSMGTVDVGPMEMRWSLESPAPASAHLPKTPGLLRPEALFDTIAADTPSSLFDDSYYTLRIHQNSAADQHQKISTRLRSPQSTLAAVKDAAFFSKTKADSGQKSDDFSAAALTHRIKAFQRSEMLDALESRDPGTIDTLSIQNRWDSLVQHNKEAPEHHKVAIPRLVQMGIDHRGAFSITKAVPQWRASGLTPIEGLKVVESILLWMESDWSEFKSKSPDHRREMMIAAYARFYEMEAILEKNQARRRRGKTPEEDLWWRDVEKDAAAFAAPKSAAPIPDGLTMDQAIRALEDAARTSDLNTLRIHISVFTSPQKIWRVAQNLTQINKELQQATGWTGGVLGLGGRVELTLAAPKISASGVMRMLPGGRILISTKLSALVHEWFHALDAVSAQQADPELPFFKINDLLSARVPTPAETRLPAVAHARVGLLGALNSPDSVWFQDRAKASAANETEYWLKSHEAAAFAFQSWMGSQNHIVSAANPSPYTTARSREPYNNPSREDLIILGAHFEDLFRSLDGMDWTGRPEPFAGFQREQAASDVAQRITWWTTSPVP